MDLQVVKDESAHLEILVVQILEKGKEIEVLVKGMREGMAKILEQGKLFKKETGMDESCPESPIVDNLYYTTSRMDFKYDFLNFHGLKVIPRAESILEDIRLLKSMTGDGAQVKA